MKVTADTITDEQIRELRAGTGWIGQAARDQEMIDDALHSFDEVRRRQARARCAEILNAREAKS